VPPPSQIRWTGLTAFADRVAARLARPDLAPTELAEVTRAIDALSRRIEQSIRRDNLQPEHLTPATREWRAWLAWLADPENVTAYRDAVARVRRAITAAAAAPDDRRVFAVRFLPIRHIYKLRSKGPAAALTLPTPMTRFDDAAFADLAAMILTRDRHAKPRVVAHMLAEPYADLAAELESLAGVVDNAKGQHHDLAASFDRVNAHYFNPPLARPKLTWSKALTRRKFGHFDHVRDQLLVSRTLDHPAVPQFVVDYLMFHELLHKKHGIRWVNGRGHAHTRAFYDDEGRFPQLADAEQWLKKLAKPLA
jgi:hypothetical protein